MLQFSTSVTLGNLLEMAAMLVAVISFLTGTRSDLRHVKKDVDDLKRVAVQIADNKARLDGQDQRIDRLERVTDAGRIQIAYPPGHSHK